LQVSICLVTSTMPDSNVSLFFAWSTLLAYKQIIYFFWLNHTNDFNWATSCTLCRFVHITDKFGRKWGSAVLERYCSVARLRVVGSIGSKFNNLNFSMILKTKKYQSFKVRSLHFIWITSFKTMCTRNKKRSAWLHHNKWMHNGLNWNLTGRK